MALPIPVIPSQPDAFHLAPHRIKRCTFRRLINVESSTDRVYDVECLFPDRKVPIPLGDLETATPICNACRPAYLQAGRGLTVAHPKLVASIQRRVPETSTGKGDLAPESEVWRRLLLALTPASSWTRRRHRRIQSAALQDVRGTIRAPGGWVPDTSTCPWAKNPKYCEGCFRTLQANHGGGSRLLAALRRRSRSTSPAEGMSPADSAP
jgi:hypothetical protein